MQVQMTAPQASASGSGATQSYSDRVRTSRLKTAVYAGVGALDVYAATASTLAPDGSVFKSMGPWVCGALAVGHAVYGLHNCLQVDTYNETLSVNRPPQRNLIALGHGITALGFAGMAFGAGPMALPLVALGEVAGVVGEYLNGKSAPPA